MSNILQAIGTLETAMLAGEISPPPWTVTDIETMKQIFSLVTSEASRDLIAKMSEVRRAQKTYFKERTQSAMHESIKIEHELDVLLAKWVNTQALGARSQVYQQQLLETRAAMYEQREKTHKVKE